MNTSNVYETPDSTLVEEVRKKWFLRSAIFYVAVCILTNLLSWFLVMLDRPDFEFNYASRIVGAVIFPNILVIPVFLALTIIRYPMIPGWYKNALKWSMLFCGILFIVGSIFELYMFYGNK